MPLSEEERGSIVQAISNVDEEVRRLAVEKLFLLPISEAAQHLYKCLGDSAWRVRKAAVERLISRSEEAPVQEMLIASLADGENSGRRNSAFEALVGCGARVTARLVGELSSDDADVRKLAVDALAAIEDPAARAPLVQAIEDVDPNVRAAAAEALGVVGGGAEIGRLMSVSADEAEDVLVRLSALRALFRMEAGVGVARVEGALEHSLLRPAAFELLGHSADPSAVDILVKGLSGGTRSSRERAMSALLRTLGRLDDWAAETLRARLCDVARSDTALIEASCERLQDDDLGSRMVLIQFLGLTGDSRVVVPILMVGRDEAIEELADATLESLGDVVATEFDLAWSDFEIGVKARACTLLGRLGGEIADRLLTKTLDSPDGELRQRAASALAEGEFFERVPDLVRCLESAAQNDGTESDDEIRTIIRSIVHLAERSEAAEAGIDDQLIEALAGRLGGAPEPVRLAIAQVLAFVGREEDEEIIGFLLKDESSAVRRAAVQALGRLDLDRARDSIRLCLADEASSVRIAAAKVLGESGRREAIVELRGLLEDQESRVVAVAIYSIARLHREGEPASDEIYALIGHALRGEPIIALAGLDALKELGGARAGKLAGSASRRCEPDVVRAAVACLGVHGSDDDLAEAISLVAHLDWSVRAEIAQVMSERRYRKSLPAMLRRLEVEDDQFVRQVMLQAIGRLEE